MKTALINCVGFIGDNLFASSIPKKLKQEGFDEVDILLSIPQPLELIDNNPYIDGTYLTNPNKQYTKIFQLYPIHRQSTPCYQFQQQCGISSPDDSFEIYTNKKLDEYVDLLLKPYRDKKVVAWMSNWEEKSFLFTEEEYNLGVDVPNLGYGGKRRDIPYIISELEKNDNIALIEVGKPLGYNQREVDLDTVSSYTLTASLLKNCDYFIGSEGGLCNLAAGVGTKTIITGDYVHQLYGWNGVIEKNQEPKLGPKYYFPEVGHVTLDPYLDDNQVVNEIIKNIEL